METLYWICEYGKVFCGYMFFMFLWPSVVFSKHLRHKDKIYRFSFCVLVQVVIANSVVLGLGLLHILNRWIVFGLFYGVFLVNLVKNFKFQYTRGSFSEIKSSVYRLIMGTSGIKLFLSQRLKKFNTWLKSLFLKFWNIVRLHLVEYSMILVVVIYGMIYFSCGFMQSYGYHFPDLFVHHQWIYGLQEGEIFSKGVYPEAMHCFVYCMNALFGIRVYSCMQLMGCIHIAACLISLYCLLREVFHWKYTPIFFLTVFLTLDITANLDFLFTMSRLPATLPQEFGMYTQFLCVLFLIRYLKSAKKGIHKVRYKDKWLKYYWDDNLFLFMLALADSIAIHFYVTIMAFMLCVPFALFFIKRIFTKERFIPLVAAVVCGVLIASAPMGGALASGKNFQGSINWALSIMKTGKSEDSTGQSENSTEQPVDNAEQAEEKSDDTGLPQKIVKTLSVLRKGYSQSYGEERAKIMVACMVFTILLLAIYYAGMMIWHKILKHPVKVWCFQLYMPMIITPVLFMAVEKAWALGLPQLIDSNRIYPIEHILLLTVMVMPADMMFTLLSVFCAKAVMHALSVFTIIGIYYVTVAFGNYHGFLGQYLARYDATVMVTNSIIDNFPKYTYTIVSPTEELYQVIEYGRHEELLTFAEKIQKENYTLPTDYVFLFVEKKPLQYAQLRLLDGPSWLGSTKYTERYQSISVYPDAESQEISEEEALKDIILYDLASDSYKNIESRIILESKLYLWCQNFSKLHPFEFHVYYEDENFVCYYFKQNPYALYDLAIEGWDRTDGIQWLD